MKKYKTFLKRETGVPHFAENYKAAAFTLAEVLITLGIIGVVAAMTLPSVINDFRDKEFVVHAKKSATVLLNTLTAVQAEYGETDYSNIFQDSMNGDETADILARHLNVIKRCKTGTNGCHDSPIKLAKPQDKDGSGTAGYFAEAGLRSMGPLLVLADGSVIAVTKYSSCKRIFEATVTDENGNVVTDEDGNILKEERVGYSCFDLTVDTNGNKGPNQIGRDIFSIFVDPDGPEKGSRGDLWNILSAEEFKVVPYTPGTPIK